MLRRDGDLVGLQGGDIRLDHHFAFGPDLVPDPAQPDLSDVQHLGSGSKGPLGLIDQSGIDRVHQAPVDLPRGLAQDGQDRHGDDKPDNRVSPVPAQRDATRAEQHGQGSQPVGAGVQPVGDQRRGADLAAGPDPVAGYQLVASEPDQRRGGDRDQVRHFTRVHQPADRLVGGQRRGRGDGEDDRDPGEVFRAPVSVGVATVRRGGGGGARHAPRARGGGGGGGGRGGGAR